MQLPIVHHPAYEADGFPAGHRFPMAKFRLLPEYLMHIGLAGPGTFHVPEAACRDTLVRSHAAAYVDAVFSGLVPKTIEREIGLPMQESVGLRASYAAGGTMLAASLAFQHGIACNTAGGSHHARAEQGSGFCVFNDVAVAVHHLLSKDDMMQIMVFDCDVHQGDGTARIFAGDKRVSTISLHGENNYPHSKVLSDMDVPLADGMEDAEYLDALIQSLAATDRMPRPDIIFYNAGVDPHHEDALGRLALTDSGLMERDKRVVDWFRERNIPVVGVIGGGYQKNEFAVAERHAILHQVCSQFI